MQKSYSIKGMHCQSCVRKIEQGLAQYADTVAVSLAEGSISLNNPKLDFGGLKEHLAALGSYELVPAIQTTAQLTKSSCLRPYFPLLLIVTYLIVMSFAGAQGLMDWMRHFMAGFFLVFSFFKILNLSAFANGYAQYDLLAMRWKPYGFIYPFCELGLGLAYLFNLWPRTILYATLILTLFSACGVLRSMQRKQEIRCACLGDLLNVPLSTATLVEDLGMAGMAALMLAH